MWDSLRAALEKGDPRRIFVGRISPNSTRVIRTAKNTPKRRQKVRPRKRVVVARRRKVIGAVGTAVRLTVFTAAVAVIAVGAYRYMRSAPRFAVTHIAVEGNMHVTAREIIEHSGIAEGQNIFRVSLTDSAEAIRQIPWVRDARLWRNLPGDIRIEIAERVPVALVPSRELFLMDGTGKILASLSESENVDAPLITCASLGPLKPGDSLSAEGADQALEIIRLIEAMRVADDIGISEINIDDPENIVMIAGGSGASIYMGAGDLAGKLWRLTKVVRSIRSNGRLTAENLEKVDLRFGATVPTRIRGG